MLKYHFFLINGNVYAFVIIQNSNIFGKSDMAYNLSKYYKIKYLKYIYTIQIIIKNHFKGLI